MITSEQLTEVINACKHMLAPELVDFRNIVANIEKSTGVAISNLQYDIKDLIAHQVALSDKLARIEYRLNNPGEEDDIYDAVRDAQNNTILNNPAMDRQEYPEGMREWEIVEFKSTHANRMDMYENNDRSGYCNMKGIDQIGAPLNMMLECVKEGTHAIHSVRRLSDGEVFTVGDKLELIGEIRQFYIKDELRMIAAAMSHVNITKLIKEKSPSFTTADGVEVLEGYNIWFMHPERFRIPTVCKAEKGLNWNTHYSTKEAAEAAYKAAVLFTTADGVRVSQHTAVYYYEVPNGAIHVGSACVVLSDPYYSTRAAAEAAYEKWLHEQPVLTLSLVKAMAHLSAVELVELEGIVKEKLQNI